MNYDEPLGAVADFISDTGIRAPVLLDSAFGDPSCRTVPADAESVTRYFQLRVGNPEEDPLYPIQVVIGPDGTFRYLSRGYDPDALLAVLEGLVGR